MKIEKPLKVHFFPEEHPKRPGYRSSIAAKLHSHNTPIALQREFTTEGHMLTKLRTKPILAGLWLLTYLVRFFDYLADSAQAGFFALLKVYAELNGCKFPSTVWDTLTAMERDTFLAIWPDYAGRKEAA